MKIVAPYGMSILLMIVCVISCGPRLKIVPDLKAGIMNTYTIQPPVYKPDTVIQHSTAIVSDLPPTITVVKNECKDTTIKRLSNALVDVVYWSHARSSKKDSTITELSNRVERYGERIDNLTKAIQEGNTASVIKKDNYEPIINWGMIVTAAMVFLHFITYLIRSNRHKHHI